MKISWFLPMTSLVCLMPSVQAQEIEPTLRTVDTIVDAERYEACLSEIDQSPEAAMESGLAWRAQGGGWASDHCIALSVIANGQFGDGARRLENTAEGATGAGDQVRAVMFGQAGDAWLAAQQSDMAMTAFTRGRFFAPEDAGLALGQAEAALELEDWAMVEAAADEAILLDPSQLDAWRMRGEARLARGDLEGARDDMQEARSLDPDNIDVLLLRGKIQIADSQQGG